MAGLEIRSTGDGAARVIWEVFDGSTVAGEARFRRRPDGRCYVYFDAWHTDTYPLLADAAGRDLGEDLYTTFDDAEFDAIDACTRAGFTENRRESHYKIPVDPAVTGLTTATAVLPRGFEAISVADAEIDRVRVLDDDLRQHVPGSDGWRWDAEGFRYEAFGRGFDPETYLIAVDRSAGQSGGQPAGQYAGLVRAWRTRVGPRLGLMGTREGYRRRGITRALLRQVFDVLHARGDHYAIAEADDDNHVSVALLNSIGARRTGGTVELIRRATAEPLSR